MTECSFVGFGIVFLISSAAYFEFCCYTYYKCVARNVQGRATAQLNIARRCEVIKYC